LTRLALVLLLAASPAFAATTKTITVPAREIHVAREHTVTLNVKDEDVHEILASMQKQCEIRNLIVDRDVDARGTFLFRAVPCSTAFKVVFQSLGLGATDYGAVLNVGRPKR
jgi:uncharacterized lipoprotein YajG